MVFTQPRIRALVLAAWIAALLATQAWPGIDEGIREEFARDAGEYRQIALAAPGLPEGPIREQHAERWVVHWLVGSGAELADVGLETAYRAASLVLVAAALALLHLALTATGAGAAAYALALGAALATPYVFRFLLAAPGMVADALFAAGLAGALAAWLRGRIELVVAGLAVAAVGRQTAVPAALVLAALLVRRRPWAAAATALVPLAAYAAVRAGAAGFSREDLPGLGSLTVLSDLDEPAGLAGHVARVLLGVLLPAALVLAALGTRRAAGVAAPLLVAAAIAAQPLLLTKDWIDVNEARLAAYAVPAAAIGAAVMLRRIALGPWRTALLSVAFFAASLHHNFSNLGVDRRLWLALYVGAALAALAVARRRA